MKAILKKHKADIVVSSVIFYIFSIFGILYASVYENAGFSLTGFTAVSGILLILFALSIKMHYNIFMQPCSLSQYLSAQSSVLFLRILQATLLHIRATALFI